MAIAAPLSARPVPVRAKRTRRFRSEFVPAGGLSAPWRPTRQREGIVRTRAVNSGRRIAMRTKVYTLLCETDSGAAVFGVYADHDSAMRRALNLAEAHAAQLRGEDEATLR